MKAMSDLLTALGITDPTERMAMARVIQMEMSANVSDFFADGGRAHTRAQCKETRKQGAPKGCVLHKPTIHKLTGSKQILRSSTLIEDVCRHGVGHPNPDSAAYLDWRDGYAGTVGSWTSHGCDGCCGPIEAKVPAPDYETVEY